MNPKNTPHFFRTIQKKDIICNFIIRDNFTTGVISSERYHFHSFYELHTVVKGQMHILVNDKDLYLESGSICVIPPNTIHYIFEEKDSFRTGFRFSFSPSNVPNTPFFLPRFQKSFHEICDIFVANDPTIYNNYLYPAALLLKEQTFSHLIDELLFLCIDSVSNIILPTHPVQESNFDSDAFRAECVEDFINSTYHDHPRIEILADSLNLSVRQTERIISRLYGMTFSELILKKRLTIAKFLLLTTSHTIEEIAFLTGFYDKSHFCRKFHDSFGVSPAAYRSTQ